MLAREVAKCLGVSQGRVRQLAVEGRIVVRRQITSRLNEYCARSVERTRKQLEKYRRSGVDAN